ncbi:hypothetical protein HJFPF1_02635 [Paramyrothecium foliicola]|nr:hypothetical protein HJFPF1_02635 [Paramyrothecium foliicola]
MVSTRSGVATEASPDVAPTPRVKRQSARATASKSPSPPSSSSSSRTAVTRTSAPRGWQHEPTQFTLVWMAVSLPLVIWDTIYVLGRPHTMEGGALHWPLWAPYKLYGTIDLVYGWYAFDRRMGFTGAQGFLNLVETSMYLVYLWMHFKNKEAARATGSSGRHGALAVLIGFSAAVMTFSKTVLYWLQEYYGDYAHIGHNAPFELILLWIIPNGAWLVGSSYMIWDLGRSILNGLIGASAHSKQA